MKLKDFLKQEVDMDIYEDVTDNLYPAFTGPCVLTDIGKKEFALILDDEVEITDKGDGVNIAIVHIDKHKNWKKHRELLSIFLSHYAGYCSEADYERWFKNE